MKRFAIGAVAALVLSACGGGGEDPPAPSSCATAADGAACADGGTCRAGVCLRTVTGRWTETRYPVTGTPQTAAVDLTGVPLSAVAETAEGFVEREGTGHADGTFEIPDVPVGRYWLVVGQAAPAQRTFHEHAESALELEESVFGRPASPTAPGTIVQWEMSGLAPWVPALSRLEFQCPNVAIGADLMWSDPEPPEGATGATVSWTPRVRPEGTLGDRVQVVQIAPVAAGDLVVFTPVAGAELPDGFAVTEGATQTVRVTLARVPTVSRTIDWDLAGFADVADALGGAGQVLRIGGNPWPGSGWAFTTHAEAAPPATPATAWRGELVYGRPAPGAWEDVWLHSVSRRVTYDFAGGGVLRTSVGSTSWGVVSQAGTTRVAPAVSAPTNVRILPASGAAPGTVGTAPTITWSAPTAGTAASYWVWVRALASGKASALFSTTRTELRVPPGVLEAGVTYLARVSAANPHGVSDALPVTFIP